MWEAFLLQMNDFDKFLDLQLRNMLDRIVATPAPPRGRRRPKARRLYLAVAPTQTGAFGAAVPEAIAVSDHVGVTASVASPQL